jgi:hypothetical protein
LHMQAFILSPRFFQHRRTVARSGLYGNVCAQPLP